MEPDSLNRIIEIQNNTFVLHVPRNANIEVKGDSKLFHINDNKNLYFGNLDKGKYDIVYISPDGQKIQGYLIVTHSLLTDKALILGIALIISFILFIYFGIRFRFAHERKKLKSLIYEKTEAFIKEQERYEMALAKKESDYDESDKRQKSKGVRYKMVTVLFSNVVGFSKLTEQDKAEKLIDDLDRFYYHFDKTVKDLNIKKIKTIGDTYVCAGGIPKKNRTNPIEVVLAAFEMQQYMLHLKSRYPEEEEKIWGLRMGTHTGHVFAQYESEKDLKYDIWGETVNIASRVEATGELNRVNISGSTYELVRDYFICQYYGKLPVKYQGDADLYVIEGFRPHLSVKGKGLVPNHDFQIKLAFIRFDDLEEEILDILERELPKNLYYHNVKHTIDVVNQVEIIARREEVSEEELLLLKTAALFHDIGYTRGYKDHELLGIQRTKEILPRYSYSEEQITKICDLIFATRMPPMPNNKLEEIICDADLDYLGRVDFVPVSNMLFRELVENEAIENNIKKWNDVQIDFISKHQYFTQSAKKLRDVNKHKQLENIRNLAD
ncbi:MAG TPA: adenylate/guanylate cyclase domain-containing protein [Salinivirgaceae bacterium]|nr:adenylate/guanylate cyclase domain-containing protein [Salinivirgaceae bacterium]